MGPERAARLFDALYGKEADSYKAVLYGSLALTGRGHGTDRVLKETLSKPVETVFDTVTSGLPHPNTMDISAIQNGRIKTSWRVFSVGGGSIEIEGRKAEILPEIYPHRNFTEISEYCSENNLKLYEYALKFEDADFYDYMKAAWKQMKDTVKEGLKVSGTLPGGLNILRKAKLLYGQIKPDESPQTRENRIVCAYAFATGEQNAAAKTVVTAPTCGAAGVVPAVMMYLQEKNGYSDERVVNALISAGVVGNVIKHNASVSGAECGCQAEIGSACSMAATAAAELSGMDIDQIEYAAEVAMEHFLGLTCDPVGGLVQVPCIERNAVAAMRALNALSLAEFLTFTRTVSLDTIIETMYQTGRDISVRYRETSEGGLAKNYHRMGS